MSVFQLAPMISIERFLLDGVDDLLSYWLMYLAMVIVLFVWSVK